MSRELYNLYYYYAYHEYKDIKIESESLAGVAIQYFMCL